MNTLLLCLLHVNISGSTLNIAYRTVHTLEAPVLHSLNFINLLRIKDTSLSYLAQEHMFNKKQHKPRGGQIH